MNEFAEQEVKEKIERAIQRIANKNTILGAILSSTELIPERNTLTVEFYRKDNKMTFNPDFVNKLGVGQIEGILIHVATHSLLNKEAH